MNSVSLRDEIRRKLIHISSLWMVLFIYSVDQKTALIFFTGLLVAFTMFEVIRMQSKRVANVTERYFSAVMRNNEKTEGFKLSGLTGSFYFLLSVVLSLFFFDKQIAMLSVTIMILSDTMAALVGKKFGKIRIWDKSLEGALAFFITTFILLFFFTSSLSVFAMIIIGLLLTGIEFVSNKFHINDNLSLTLAAGFLINVFSYFSL